MEETLEGNALSTTLTVADELNDLRQALASNKAVVRLAGISAARLRQCLSSKNQDTPTSG